MSLELFTGVRCVFVAAETFLPKFINYKNFKLSHVRISCRVWCYGLNLIEETEFLTKSLFRAKSCAESVAVEMSEQRAIQLFDCECSKILWAIKIN